MTLYRLSDDFRFNPNADRGKENDRMLSLAGSSHPGAIPARGFRGVRVLVLATLCAVAPAAGTSSFASGPMHPLIALQPVTLGAAADGAEAWCAVLPVRDGRLVVAWRSPAGKIMQSVAVKDAAAWSPPSPATRDASETGGPGESRSSPRGLLARTSIPAGEVALRSGQRVVGVPPTFPSAGLVVSISEEDRWRDLAFADEIPDATVAAASLLVTDDRIVGAYVTDGADGAAACRVIQMPLDPVPPSAGSWGDLPPHPSGIGVAGVLAGVHEGVLIAAGGANFPDAPPWEGGRKITHDPIFVLRAGEKNWRPAGNLSQPRAYAAVASLAEGVLAAGGENSATIFQDSLLLRCNGDEVAVERGPDLPEPLTSAMMAVLDGKVYLAGGYAPGPPRTTRGGFWCYDPARPLDGWRSLPGWPGPTRAQGVMAALGGAIYLISGLELQPATDGGPQARYLRDAYRYRPGRGWEILPDPPWSAIGAPSPAPVTVAPARVFVLGGVDGRQAGQLPRDTRLPADILYFDATANGWRLWPEPSRHPVVTAPAVQSGDEWIIVSGETMAGVRTPLVRSWRIDDSPADAGRRE